MGSLCDQGSLSWIVSPATTFLSGRPGLAQTEVRVHVHESRPNNTCPCAHFVSLDHSMIAPRVEWLCLESDAMFGTPGEHYLGAEKDAMAAAAAAAGAAATDDANNAAPAGIRMDGGSKL